MGLDKVTVGSVEIVSVLDGLMDVHPAFMFSGIPPEVYTEALGEELRPAGVFQLRLASFLVRSSGKTILIDTGMGPKNPLTPGGELLNNLATVEVKPEDIDVVTFTHLHVDHVGWNCVERDGKFVPTFPNAQYVVAEAEWDYWTEPETAAEEGDHITKDVLPLRDSPQLQLVAADAAITSELSLLPTPGHTPGHSSIAIASGGERAIILGDVAHHPLHLVRMWISAIDELPRTSRRTKRALAKRLVEEQTLVAAGHFAPSSFGRLVMDGGRRAWRAL